MSQPVPRTDAPRPSERTPDIDFDHNPMALEIVQDIPEDSGDGMTEPEINEFLTRPFVEGGRQ